MSRRGCSRRGRRQWLPGGRRRGTVRDDGPDSHCRRAARRGCGRAAGRQLARGRVRRDRGAQYGGRRSWCRPRVGGCVRACITMDRILIPLSKRSVRRALEIAETSGRAGGFRMAPVRGSWYTTQQSGEGEFAMKAALLAAVLAAAAFAALASATTPAPTKVVGNVKVGRSLFIVHDCGACHMMAAANAIEPVGDRARPRHVEEDLRPDDHPDHERGPRDDRVQARPDGRADPEPGGVRLQELASLGRYFPIGK